MESHAQLITDDDGREYLKVHDTAEVLETVDETDEYVDYEVALATEIVQEYNIDGERKKVYKPSDQLQRATQTAYGAYITDGHPSEGVVKSPDHINGHIRGPEWSDDKDTILGKARVFKKDENQKFRDEIDSGDRTDVSIGFYTRLVDESGEFNDQAYDKKQTNMVIDHLAILKPDNKGRCSPGDGCGILSNMDHESDSMDIAYHDAEEGEAVMETLREDGFEVEMRECNCGDHEGHITVGEPSDDTDSDGDGNGSDSDDTDDSRDRYKRDGEKSSDRGSIMGDNDKQLSDYSVDELSEEHDGVADLVDQKESLEDELDEMKESQRDELREEIKDEFEVSDERVADKDIDELEDLKETLDEVTANDGDDEDDENGDGQSDSQGSTTSTNPPNNNTDSSGDGSGLAPTSGEGQFADEYE